MSNIRKLQFIAINIEFILTAKLCNKPANEQLKLKRLHKQYKDKLLHTREILTRIAKIGNNKISGGSLGELQSRNLSEKT